MRLRVDGPSSTNTRPAADRARGLTPRHGGVVAELLLTGGGMPLIVLRADVTDLERQQAACWAETLIFRDRVLTRPMLSVN